MPKKLESTTFFEGGDAGMDTATGELALARSEWKTIRESGKNIVIAEEGRKQFVPIII